MYEEGERMICREKSHSRKPDEQSPIDHVSETESSERWQGSRMKRREERRYSREKSPLRERRAGKRAAGKQRTEKNKSHS